MLARNKFKDHWAIQANNNQTSVLPTQVQIYNQSQFSTRGSQQNGSEMYSLIKAMQGQGMPEQTYSKVNTIEGLEKVQSELQKCNYLWVRLFTQFRMSYKGFVSWILIGNSHCNFLIDGIALRNSISKILNVFENPNIVKFIFDWNETYQNLKRDFGIFPINNFDLYFLQSIYQDLMNQGCQYRTRTAQQLYSNSHIVVERPLDEKMSELVMKAIAITNQYIKKLCKDQTLSLFSQKNNQNILFCHYNEINSAQALGEAYQFRVNQPLLRQQIDNLTPNMQKLYQELIKFREHVAKTHDVCSQYILPRSVILKILSNSNISVLQIFQTYQQSDCSSVGIQICKRIYDVIKLNQQLIQQQLKLSQFVFNQKQKDECMAIKKLLKQIKWGDSSQWLNRKDDQSIKLYKQIVSIDKFDYSVGEEYISMMKGSTIKKCQLGKYLKYAQCMRNKDYAQLQKLCKQNLQAVKLDQFSEGSDEQQRRKKKQESKRIHRKLFSDSKQKQIKSATSLQEGRTEFTQKLVQQKIKSCFQNQSLNQIQNIEQSSSNSRSRRSSETSSFNLMELDDIMVKRSDIKPLPNSIEQIYEMAQQVKKKADKKLSKKKQKKVKSENKKEVQFIPSWQDIEQLIKNLPQYK